MARRGQVVTDFYLVGLLAAAATLFSGCLVLPTMARNTLRSTVSEILAVRMRTRPSAGHALCAERRPGSTMAANVKGQSRSWQYLGG